MWHDWLTKIEKNETCTKADTLKKNRLNFERNEFCVVHRMGRKGKVIWNGGGLINVSLCDGLFDYASVLTKSVAEIYLTELKATDMNWIELRLQLNWVIHIQTHAAKSFVAVLTKKKNIYIYLKCSVQAQANFIQIMPEWHVFWCYNSLAAIYSSTIEYIISCAVFSVFYTISSSCPAYSRSQSKYKRNATCAITWPQNCGHPHYLLRNVSKRRQNLPKLSCETDLVYPYPSGLFIRVKDRN